MTKAEQKAFYKTKEGKALDKETYSKWKSLVNMSKGELESFYNSKEGKEAGLSAKEAKAEGIDSGRESARWIIKMKDIPYTEWTSNMWIWAKKQISFVSRMKGMRGDLYDDKGNKTRKHLALLIWGHNPKKMAEGGGIYKMMYGGSVNFFGNEFDDSDYKWKYDLGNLPNKAFTQLGITLEELIEFPELFRKYPILKKNLVFFNEIKDENLGADSYVDFSDPRHPIYLNLHFNYFKQNKHEKYEINGKRAECSKEAVLLHEVQHLCQSQNGRFTRYGYEEALALEIGRAHV
jgi:hypothetical protein